jgi:pimeloyl-ACP methyl ester carboxylesterase
MVMVDGSTYVGDEEVLVGQLRLSIAQLGYDRFMEDLFSKMFVPGSDEELKRHFIARAQTLDPELAEALLTDSIRWDLAHGDEALVKVQVPTLVLQSTYFKPGSGRVPLQSGMTTPFMSKMKQLVPHSTIEIMTGVGHCPMVEQSEAFATRLRDFASHLR